MIHGFSNCHNVGVCVAGRGTSIPIVDNPMVKDTQIISCCSCFISPITRHRALHYSSSAGYDNLGAILHSYFTNFYTCMYNEYIVH